MTPTPTMTKLCRIDPKKLPHIYPIIEEGMRRIFPVAKWRVERNAANAEREVGPPPLTLSVSVSVLQCRLCNFVQGKNKSQHDNFCAVRASVPYAYKRSYTLVIGDW